MFRWLAGAFDAILTLMFWQCLATTYALPAISRRGMKRNASDRSRPIRCMERQMPTRSWVLFWTTLIMILLSIVTTNPFLTWPSYFFKLGAAFFLSIALLVS